MGPIVLLMGAAAQVQSFNCKPSALRLEYLLTSTYAWVLLLSGAVPLAISGYPGLRFWRHGRALAASLALVVTVFGVWDVYATAAGHWWFDPRGVWPLRIFGLPLEEVLFFVVIPFCCLLLWEVVCYFAENRK